MPDHDFINILSHFINILKGLSFCNFEKGIDGGYYFQSGKKKMPSFSLLWLFEWSRLLQILLIYFKLNIFRDTAGKFWSS